MSPVVAPTVTREAPSRTLTEFRCRLQHARQRGMSFNAGWKFATRSRLWGSHDIEWRRALEQTRAEWEAAYYGRPSPIGSSLDSLARALQELDHGVRIAELDGRRTLAA